MHLPESIRRRLPAARRLEWYPPFRGMRVRVLELSPDWRHARLLLPLAVNRNPGGGMFGGAMACLADPIAALACNKRFPGHQVWTRQLHLDFRREGRTDMELRFTFAADLEAQIRTELAERGRATPAFAYGFYDQRGRLCVAVDCHVAIRPVDFRPGAALNRSNSEHE